MQKRGISGFPWPFDAQQNPPAEVHVSDPELLANMYPPTFFLYRRGNPLEYMQAGHPEILATILGGDYADLPEDTLQGLNIGGKHCARTLALRIGAVVEADPMQQLRAPFRQVREMFTHNNEKY